MQREGGDEMIVANRRGFSMLMAITVIIIMSTVAILVLSLTARTARATTAQYQKEQAFLLAKSYTEYAVMAIGSNDRGSSCIQTISASNVYGGYDVEVDVGYIGSANEIPSGCGTSMADNNMSTDQLHVILDTYVRYKDPDNSTNRMITYHKRTLQKI